MGVLWGWRLTPAGIQRDSLKSGKRREKLRDKEGEDP